MMQLVLLLRLKQIFLEQSLDTPDPFPWRSGIEALALPQ
jgi:hypothetical protein